MDNKKQILMNDILKALDELEEIVQSEENQKKQEMFKDVGEWGRDMWRGVPQKTSNSCVPFTVAPDNSFWSALFNTSLKEFYSDPFVHLLLQLKIKIFTYRNFKDDTYLKKEIYIWFSIISSLSFFGPPVSFFDNREPVLHGRPILANPDDLEKMEFPDFKKSGLMPRIHMYYEELNAFLKGRFKVMFPQWARGPYAIAIHLRGFENFLMDTIERPEFVHKLMRFITDARKKWFVDRSEYIKEPIPMGKLYNDEIDSSIISPSTYNEFIYPYEKELSEFHNGISYYHSCGNTTQFMEQIAKIPRLEYAHVSPWSDVDKALKAYSDQTALDIVLNPLDDCYTASEEEMAEKIRQTVYKCGEKKRYSIRIDGFQPFAGIEKDTHKIVTWSKVAREILNKY